MFLLTITFLHTLKEWDQRLFIKLNSDWTNSFFDSVVPYLRHPLTWSPFYLFLIVFALMNFRLKGLWWILFLGCTVALTDLTGTYVFKSFFYRTRPCGDVDFSSHVRLLLDHCSNNSSFISNHAANHFGMAMFIFLTLRRVLKNKAWIIFIWPVLVAYAQVYVGIHYPLDVLAGSLIGLGWGYLIASAFNNQFGFAIFGNQPVE